MTAEKHRELVEKVISMLRAENICFQTCIVASQVYDIMTMSATLSTTFILLSRWRENISLKLNRMKGRYHSAEYIVHEATGHFHECTLCPHFENYSSHQKQTIATVIYIVGGLIIIHVR